MRALQLILILMLMVGCNGGSDPPPQEPEVDEVIRELHRLHTTRRHAVGNLELHIDDRLLLAARTHAEWMAKMNMLDHAGPNGKTVLERVRDFGYHESQLGENIAMGFNDPRQLIEAWMGSPDHKINILHEGYRDVGYGRAKSADGFVYWCVIFGRHISQPRAEGVEVPGPNGVTPPVHNLIEQYERQGAAP